MEFERVGGVPMCDFRAQICWQVDNRDSFERAPITEEESVQFNTGRTIIRNTHFLTQIPQPIHRNSEMKEILSVGFTSIHCLPVNDKLVNRA